MGLVVYRVLISLVFVISGLWVLKYYIDDTLWFIIAFFSLLGFVIQPAWSAYQDYVKKNKAILTNSICGSCKNYDPSAPVCIKYDENPTETYVPCDGLDWDPRSDL